MRSSGVRRPWMPATLAGPDARPVRLLHQITPPPLVRLGGADWQPQPARLPNTDPLRPTASMAGQQPVPGAQLWKPEAAREPNADPLRPATLVQDAPDATLAQPTTSWVGRLSRD